MKTVYLRIPHCGQSSGCVGICKVAPFECPAWPRRSEIPRVFLPLMAGGERWERQAAEYRARLEERQETTDGS